MAEHPVAGERILLRIPELAAIAPVVRHEHEHWDGTGYPDGLRGRQIPIGSRIILACDAYHAMITARPYRAGADAADAVARSCARGAGAQFDPRRRRGAAGPARLRRAAVCPTARRRADARRAAAAADGATGAQRR